MTLIASLLFAIALIASVAVIALTFSNAMPRIIEVIDMELVPTVALERRITYGAIKGRTPQPCVLFLQQQRVDVVARAQARPFEGWPALSPVA